MTNDLILTYTGSNFLADNFNLNEDGRIANISTDWGDNSEPGRQSMASALSHGYKTPGTYTITITSVDSEYPIETINSSALEQISGLTSVIIPDTVYRLSSGVFNGDTDLSTVVLGSGLTEIGSGCFSGCSGLTSITIPSSVTTIGDYAFSETGLTSITFEGTTPPQLGEDAFFDTNNFIVYVPTGSLSAYQNAENFPDNVTYVEYTPQSSSSSSNPTATLYNHIKQLNKQWFYEKSEIDQNLIAKSSTSGLVKNDGTIDTNVYLTEHQSLSNYIQKSSTVGLVKNDGTIDTNVYLTEHQNISGKEDKTNKVSSWSGTPTNDHYPSELLVKNSLDAKADLTDLPQNLSDLTDDVGYLTEHQSLDSKTVSVQKISTESGYAASYAVMQNGSQVGATINIPKDFLVKDAGLSEVSTADTPVSGYEVGDKYLWFKINTVGSDATDEYIYVLVTDLIDVYSADNSTLTLSSGVFSVKNGGIGTTQLSSGVNTSLGYADAWNSSAAKNITSSDISNWNAKGSSNLTIADVDAEVEAYLQAIITALNNE